MRKGLPRTLPKAAELPQAAAAAIGHRSNVEMGQARFVGLAAFLSAIHLGSEWVRGERVQLRVPESRLVGTFIGDGYIPWTA